MDSELSAMRQLPQEILKRQRSQRLFKFITNIVLHPHDKQGSLDLAY